MSSEIFLIIALLVLVYYMRDNICSLWGLSEGYTVQSIPVQSFGYQPQIIQVVPGITYYDDMPSYPGYYYGGWGRRHHRRRR